MVTATGVVSVIVQLFVVDRIVNRYGERAVLNVFIAVAAAGFLFSLYATSYSLFFIISLFIFLSTSILRPVLNTLISKLAGNEQGFAMGMNNAYMSIGNVIGPTFAGLLYDIKITYPFVLGFVLLIVTLFITFSWQKRSIKAKTAI
jgi:MFS transporter, DHA1 family, multidrug resistance protein